MIYEFPRLEWGEICEDDFYHAFRTYDQRMRSWIHGLKEGESAFDNEDPAKRPHRIVNGKIVENIRKIEINILDSLGIGSFSASIPETINLRHKIQFILSRIEFLVFGNLWR